MKLKFTKINENHINAAIRLVLSAYNNERKTVNIIPDYQSNINGIRENIEKLFTEGTGIAAVSNNNLIGYLAGYEIEELFGKCRGIYSPLYGHGTIKKYRNRIYCQLYQEAAKEWVEKSLLTHAITLFAHDKKTIDTWFWLGFGHRCVDAIRKVSSIKPSAKRVKDEVFIKKTNLEDVSEIAFLEQNITEYMNLSPMFMPRNKEKPVDSLTEWLNQDNHHHWTAYLDNKPVGYIKIEPKAETFVANHQDVMNITGAYVLQEHRDSNVGTLLLDTVMQWLNQENYRLCGVDFESFNILGSIFWMNYFTPYTFSLVRRIDERIAEI